jgi:regulation of enolase protein 1 (concanavalin A-like superfamily)
MRKVQRKSKLKSLWIALGGLAGLALVFAAIQIFQAGFIAKGDERIALTQVALQVEQNNILRDIATLEASGSAASAPTTTIIAQQIINLEGTVQALDSTISALEATRAASPEEEPISVLIPTPFQISEQAPANSATPIPASNGSQRIAITDPENPNGLAQGWRWFPGPSESSDYRLEQNDNLMLIAGPTTDMWGNVLTAPYVEREISGAFQAQVRLDFDPTERWQVAGLGLRSLSSPGDWVVIRRLSSGGNGQYLEVAQTSGNNSEAVATVPYAKTTVYLRIQRAGEKLIFSASENSINWIDLESELVFTMTDKVELFLFVYSTSNHGILAQFSDVQIAPPQSRKTYVAGDSVPLETSANLNADMGWFPGISSSSSFQVRDGHLTIISGPRTNIWGTENTAPRVEFLIVGKLDTQVRVNFNGSERWQVAGIGLRSGTDPRDWIMLRLVSSGNNQRSIEVTRTLDNGSEAVASIPYSGTTLYLSIKREEPLISFYYSTDEDELKPVLENFVMGLPENNWLFLSTFSTTDNGIQGTFSELTLSSP